MCYHQIEPDVSQCPSLKKNALITLFHCGRGNKQFYKNMLSHACHQGQLHSDVLAHSSKCTRVIHLYYYKQVFEYLKNPIMFLYYSNRQS